MKQLIITMIIIVTGCNGNQQKAKQDDTELKKCVTEYRIVRKNIPWPMSGYVEESVPYTKCY